MKITEAHLRKIISKCLKENYNPTSFMQMGYRANASGIDFNKSYGTDTGNAFTAAAILQAEDEDLDEDETVIDEDEEDIHEEEV